MEKYRKFTPVCEPIKYEGVKSFNRKVVEKTGKYQSQLQNVNFGIIIPKTTKTDEVLKLYLDSNYYGFKNHNFYYILTRKGYKEMNNLFMKSYIRILGVKVLDYKVPTVNNRINYPIFKSHIMAIKSFTCDTISDEFPVYTKPASSYDGDFLGLATKEDGEINWVHYGYTNVYPIIINIITPVDDKYFRAACSRIKFNYAVNGKIRQCQQYREGISGIKEENRNYLFSLTEYLFGYDSRLFYDDLGKFTLAGIEYICKDIMENESIVWFIKLSYNKEEFKSKLDSLMRNVLIRTDLVKLNHNPTQELWDSVQANAYTISKVVTDVVDILDNNGRFIEVENFYEDSYNEEEDE